MQYQNYGHLWMQALYDIGKAEWDWQSSMTLAKQLDIGKVAWPWQSNETVASSMTLATLAKATLAKEVACYYTELDTSQAAWHWLYSKILRRQHGCPLSSHLIMLVTEPYAKAKFTAVQIEGSSDTVRSIIFSSGLTFVRPHQSLVGHFSNHGLT